MPESNKTVNAVSSLIDQVAHKGNPPIYMERTKKVGYLFGIGIGPTFELPLNKCHYSRRASSLHIIKNQSDNGVFEESRHEDT